MDLYLMQHGLAVAEEADPTRPLTPTGRAEVERVAQAAAAAGVRVERCCHSGKLRAAQTATILADALGARVEALDGLAPADPTEPVVTWLDTAARAGGGAIAVVGHLPFLDRLAAQLVTGDADGHVVQFRNAGLVRLTPSGAGSRYAIAWVLTPDLLPGE